MDAKAGIKLIGILALTAAIYSPLRNAPLVYEDFNWHGQTANVSLMPGRSLTAWTFMHTWDPRTAHLTNIAIHLANGVLTYGLASALIPGSGLIAAGIVLLHPLNSEAVSYVSARTDLLMTFGTLLAVWASLVVSPVRLALMALGMVIAMTSKELGAVAVPLVAVTVWLWRAHTRLVAALALVMLVGAVVNGFTLSNWLTLASFAGGTTLTWHQWIAYQSTALWWMLSRLVYPMGFTIDHDWLAVPLGWQQIAVCLTFVVSSMAITAWRSWRSLAWGITWVLLSVGPRFVFRTNELLNEHQMYLAVAGLSVLIGCWCARLCMPVRLRVFA